MSHLSTNNNNNQTLLQTKVEIQCHLGHNFLGMTKDSLRRRKQFETPQKTCFTLLKQTKVHRLCLIRSYHLSLPFGKGSSHLHHPKKINPNPIPNFQDFLLKNMRNLKMKFLSKRSSAHECIQRENIKDQQSPWVQHPDRAKFRLITKYKKHGVILKFKQDHKDVLQGSKKIHKTNRK